MTQTEKKISNFNSIKVRLERISAYGASDAGGFQFHKGAIRTSICLYVRLSYVDFNSIKVRLELLPSKRKADFLPNFNSIKVRLEQEIPIEDAKKIDVISIP